MLYSVIVLLLYYSLTVILLIIIINSKIILRVCDQETVGVFLSHPSVKDEPDLEGRTAFMWAAGKGSDDVIRTMLTLTPHIDINMTDKYGGSGEHL